MVSKGSTQFDGSHVLDARTPADQLPEDPRVLRQMVLTLLANVDTLQHELLWYQRHLFGRRSEKLDPDQQMLFDLLEHKIQQQTAEPKPVSPKPPAKPSARNGHVPLPRHLPRERTEYHPPQEALKLVGAVCRMAGIMHGLMHAGPDGLPNLQIDLETVLGAIAIGEYLIPHAKAAFFEMAADPSIDIARKILRWVQAERLSVFSKRDAFNRCRGTGSKVAEMDEPLRLLTSHGYIREQEMQRDGPGRKPSQNYDVNPLWLAQNTHNPHNTDITDDSAHCAECAEEVQV